MSRDKTLQFKDIECQIWLKKKKQWPTICCLQETHFKPGLATSFIHDIFFSFLFFFEFYFIFKLYIIVLVLPNIKMIPPQEYMCSPSWTLLPPPSDSIPLGRPSAPAPSIQYRASNLDWQLVSYMIFYKFQCHSPKSSHPLPLPQSP